MGPGDQPRVAILFEGRDAAGKGGTIRRFTEHLNPRAIRVVALPKPTDEEQGQWYFQRYMEQLPNPGEIVFFDRSWYNRAVVEPVNGFCTPDQYDALHAAGPGVRAHALRGRHRAGEVLVLDLQGGAGRPLRGPPHQPAQAVEARPVDDKAQELWDQYTQYKEAMFSRTHTSYSPWTIVPANDKRKARLRAMRYVLNLLPYTARTRRGSDRARSGDRDPLPPRVREPGLTPAPLRLYVACRTARGAAHVDRLT